MEIGVQKLGGFEISGKSMSLDVHSIYVKKSRRSVRDVIGNDGNSVNRKEFDELKSESKATFEDCGSLLAELTQKRSREGVEFNLSSSEPLVKKRTKNLSAVEQQLVTPDDSLQNNDQNSFQSVSVSDGSVEVSGNLEDKDCSSGELVAPKRTRGVSKGRTGTCANSSAKNNSLNVNSNLVNNQNGKSQISCIVKTEASSSKQNKKDNGIKQSGSVGENSLSTPIKEISSYTQVKDTKTRSRKNFSVAEQTFLSENLSVVDGRDKSVAYSQQFEQENLEENAARMLSSRFDPSCTGFSSFETVQTSRTMKVPPNVQSNNASLNHLQDGSSSEVASGRILRPMRQSGKSFSRKRRHFYEVLSKDMDPLYIVKQRISVFWPLDDSWYFGFVNTYDPVTKLHHIKYDDHEEEWVNLYNERFKLLLFPSELSRKFNSRRIVLQKDEKNREGEAKSKPDGCVENLSDSETFNSWLTRASHQKKSKSACILKKQSTVARMNDLKASILLESMGSFSGSPSDKIADKLFTNCNAHQWSENGEVLKNLNLQSSNCLKVNKLQYVYSRKRRHERKVPDGKLDQNAGHYLFVGSNSNLASAGDCTTSVGQLKIVLPSFQVLKMRLSLQFQCIWEFAVPVERFLLCYCNSVIDYGRLISLWPVVHMEIIFVHRDVGMRLLSFEGCLRRAVVLLCLILKTSSRHDQKFIGSIVPVTLIGIELSSVHSLGGKLLFLVSQFSKLENEKWAKLNDQLKRYCVIKEVEVANFTTSKWFSTIKTRASVVCEKCFLESNLGVSCSNLVHSSMCAIALPCSLLSQPVPCTFNHQLVTENNAGSFCLTTTVPVSPQERSLYGKQLTSQGCDPHGDSFDEITEVGLPQSDNYSSQSVSGHASHNNAVLCSIADDDSKVLAQSSINDDNDAFVHGSSSCEDVAKTKTLAIKNGQSLTYEKSFSFPHTSSSRSKSYERSNSCCDATEIHQQYQNMIPNEALNVSSASALPRKMIELGLHSPTAPRSTWHRNHNTSISHTVRRPKLWQEDFMPNGPLCGFKKPRSQISYPALSRNDSVSIKQHRSQQKAQSHKKIKTDHVNRTSDCTGSSQSYLNCLTCEANLLVTSEDKGWRECGVQVVLDSDDKNNWSICVKVLGSTKYYHKVHHILQPGATNRYTHAMMWKGGKEWILEFPDRSHWVIFKQIHEECYNRNVRAASIKNIPIPGVRLIADGDDNTIGVPLVRSSSKYFRQVGTYVDFALDPSHVLYDMDSEDEEWMSNIKSSSDSKDSQMSELTEDLFERIMDNFEKLAYRKQCHEFNTDEIDEFMVGVGPADVVKAIYEHWSKKRRKKGLPLIRQFQPPMWEFYQQQLNDWESAMTILPNQQEGFQDKEYSIKKPPMFAFCLRPRGLKVPNKGSKQRSHKKLMYSNIHHAPRGIDGLHAFGRKHDSSSAGEEKTSVTSLSYESSDSIHEHDSLVSFSPIDTASTESLFPYDASERYLDQKLYRSNSKTTGAFLSPKDSQVTPFSPGQRSKRSGAGDLDCGISELPVTEQLHCAGIQRCPPDADEFRLRDASSAAQHALNMAKLKRVKANWLLHKADLAIHRATVALITAEAIKASRKDTLGDG